MARPSPGTGPCSRRPPRGTRRRAVGSEGDALFVAFPTRAEAVRSAVAAQRALAAHPWPAVTISVRMGIHTGEVLSSAATTWASRCTARRVSRRLATAARSSLTDATRVVAGEIAAGIAFLDLGEHRLKDFARAERLFQVEADGLETSFPRSRRSTHAQQPAAPADDVRRAGRGGDAVALLDRTRLLTLTGPGGTGKTRLSLPARGRLHRPVPRRHLVRAARVGHRSRPRAVGHRGGPRAARAAAATVDRVKDHLKDRTALLVLDNFEQVVAGAADRLGLLRPAPKLR